MRLACRRGSRRKLGNDDAVGYRLRHMGHGGIVVTCEPQGRAGGEIDDGAAVALRNEGHATRAVPL